MNANISSIQLLHQQTATVTSSMPISAVDSYFINTNKRSRQLLHQYPYQQQIATSSMSISAVDSYFVNANIISKQIIHQYQYQQYIATSSMPISAVDSYFINTCISSRQLPVLHLCQYQQQIATSSMPISAVDINTNISSNTKYYRLLSQYQVQFQLFSEGLYYSYVHNIDRAYTAKVCNRKCGEVLVHLERKNQRIPLWF